MGFVVLPNMFAFNLCKKKLKKTCFVVIVKRWNFHFVVLNVHLVT